MLAALLCFELRVEAAEVEPSILGIYALGGAYAALASWGVERRRRPGSAPPSWPRSLAASASVILVATLGAAASLVLVERVVDVAALGLGPGLGNSLEAIALLCVVFVLASWPVLGVGLAALTLALRPRRIESSPPP